MKKNFLENIYSSHHIVIFVLYISLIVGFALNENSTGGAYIDYLGQKKISISFANNFLETFLNFDELKTRHSPIIPIYFSIFKYFNLNEDLVRLLSSSTVYPFSIKYSSTNETSSELRCIIVIKDVSTSATSLTGQIILGFGVIYVLILSILFGHARL